MKNYFVALSVLSIVLLSLTFSCTDPTTLGSELLEQEQANVLFTDTLTLTMSTVREDSVKTFDPDPNAQFTSYLCGNYKDDIFGTHSAGIFTQLRTSTTAVPDAFRGAALDSVILHLAYDSLAFYGDQAETYSISVFRITDDMDPGGTYFSTDTFAYNPISPLGNIDFIPHFDSIDIVDYSDTAAVKTLTRKVAPQLRIPLSTEIGEELLNMDSSTLNNIANFLNEFKGIYIKPTSLNQGIMGFFLNTSLSGLTVYYTKDGESNFYSFVSNSNAAKTTFIETDFPPNVISAFDDTNIGDSILYIQGLAGPNIRFDIPYAGAFKNTIINKAELIVTVSSEEDPLRRTPTQVVAATRMDDGTYLVIDDVLLTLSRLSLFGGQVEEVEGMREYRFNLSAVFQTLVDDSNESLYLRILPKQEQATRMTVFGPGHSQFPAKLNIVYTSLTN